MEFGEEEVEFVDDGDRIGMIRATVELESSIVETEDVTDETKESGGVSPRVEFGRGLLEGQLGVRSEHEDKENGSSLLDRSH